MSPHHAEPFSDSPTMVGSMYRQTHEWRVYLPPPHLKELFLDSPTTVEGVHRLSSSPERRGGVPTTATSVKPFSNSPKKLGAAH